jgi:hypothetical protein
MAVQELRMVHLTTAANAFEARVIAAHLGAEGVVWELRGAVDGPLAFGTVEVFVDADGYDTARDVVLGDQPERPVIERRETTGRDVWMAALALVALLLFAVVRMAAKV